MPVCFKLTAILLDRRLAQSGAGHDLSNCLRFRVQNAKYHFHAIRHLLCRFRLVNLAQQFQNQFQLLLRVN